MVTFRQIGPQMRLLNLILVLIAAVAIILGLSKPGFLSSAWYARVILLAGGLTLMIYQVRLTDKAEKERALRHMAGRQPLTEIEFGRKFFPPQQAEVASKLRSIMTRHIPVDLSRILPDDRLVDDLRMDALDSMSTVEFVLEVEKEFDIRIPAAAAEKMRTLRDVIVYVSQAKRGLAA